MIDREEGEIPTMPDSFHTVATLGLEGFLDRVREHVLEYEGVALC